MCHNSIIDFRLQTSIGNNRTSNNLLLFEVLLFTVSIDILVFCVQIQHYGLGTFLFFLIHNLRIDLRCAYVGMSQHLTDGVDVCSTCQLESGIGVPEAMHNLSKSNGK